VVAVELPMESFAGLLRQLRLDAGLSQEELATAAGVGVRTVSDLERGVALTARKDTARLLADALNLTGTARASFEAVARGRAAPGLSPAPGGGVAGAAMATRALPRDIGSFTGRQPELQQLIAMMAGSSHPGVVSIHAIGGMAGIGKTALAVHAAHQLAPSFPDGQIFLPLHGHTPGQRPVDPSDALASLLLTAGVSAAQIPPGLEARTALWRDRLAGRQLLLLLDDAADSDQVRPLLPGSAGSLVLVTSRRHLTALEDAHTLSLDTLTEQEAAELLVRLAARPGLDPGNPEVAQITRLCGYLPLAIGMLARQLHHHPAWTVKELAADLVSATTRLELMYAENLSVAAAFDLSYAELAPGQQQLFRRLGLHPGAEIDGYAAAALDHTDLAIARRQLSELYERYLLAEPARGRYRFHDLIREHARTLATADDPAENGAAAGRLLDYYQHTADAAGDMLAQMSRTRPDPAARTAPPNAVPDLPDRARALAWVRAERTNLLACLDEATRASQHERVVALTAGLAALLRQDGPWTDAVIWHSAAVLAARHVGDRPGEAGALRDLGLARLQTNDYTGATEVIQEALGVSRDIGDRHGEANALLNLAYARLHTGDYPGAVSALEEALDMTRDLGDRQGEASTLLHLGTARRLTGEYKASAEATHEALRLYGDLGDQINQGNALNDLGQTRVIIGDYPGAIHAYQEALGIFRDLGNLRGQARSLNCLGQVGIDAGDYRGAAQMLEEALGIYRDLGEALGEANVLRHLATIQREAGDHLEAAQKLEEALGIFRDIGHPLGEANVLSRLAAIRREAGNHLEAARMLEEALGIYRDIGSRDGEAEALNEAGALNRISGDLDRAVACHGRALDLAREISSPKNEACALAGLGRCALADGRTADAETALREAHEIFQRTGVAEAADVAAELEALTRPQQAGDQ
jgi:tetratricopeptide (TPR) repeat protein/DNA-binding XRE family transcriptional regulator